MSQSGLDTRVEHGEANSARRHSLVYGALPQIAVLVLTILGVAYTSVAKRPLIGYWEMLGVITGAVCVISGWPHARTRDARVQLIWTQGLHWLAFLVAMNLVLVSDVQRMLNADATGLAILLLLALGTFVAGVHTLSWQTSCLGWRWRSAFPPLPGSKNLRCILLLCGRACRHWRRIFVVPSPPHPLRRRERLTRPGRFRPKIAEPLEWSPAASIDYASRLLHLRQIHKR